MSLNRFKNNFKMLLLVTISLTLKTLTTTRQGLLSVGSAKSKLLSLYYPECYSGPVFDKKAPKDTGNFIPGTYRGKDIEP